MSLGSNKTGGEKMFRKRLLVVAGLSLLLVQGCHKEEKTVEVSSQQVPSTKAETANTSQTAPAFESSLPATLGGLSSVPGGKGNAEVLNSDRIDKVASIKSGAFELHGWAIDDATKTIPETIYLELLPMKGGKHFFAAGSRNERVRPDLAKFFNDQSMNKAGFVVKADATSLPVGEYKIRIVQAAGGKAIWFSPDIKIQR